MSTPTAAQARQLAEVVTRARGSICGCIASGGTKSCREQYGVGSWCDACLLHALTAASAAQEATNEQQAFERLSQALTGGNAATWEQVFHAAEAAEARLTAQEAEIAPLRAREAQMRTALEKAHNATMNIPYPESANERFAPDTQLRAAYREGFRDARHRAAEIVAALAPQEGQEGR